MQVNRLPSVTNANKKFTNNDAHHRLHKKFSRDSGNVSASIGTIERRQLAQLLQCMPPQVTCLRSPPSPITATMTNTEQSHPSVDTVSTLEALPKPIQIYKNLRKQIVSEQLKPGSKLPSVFQLCAQLEVSKSTVNKALELLLSEGYIQTFVGTGTFVRGGIQSKDVSESVMKSSHSQTTVVPFSSLGMRISQLVDMSPVKNTPVIELNSSGKQGALNYWKRACAQALEEVSTGSNALIEQREKSLRHEIAVRLTETRGVVCRPKQIIPLPSREVALDLITRLHVNAGDLVAFQDPVSFSLRSIFLNQGADIFELPCELTEEKLLTLPSETWRNLKLLYLTPSCAIPSGETITPKTRAALLSLAIEHKKLIVEDDYFVEYAENGLSTKSMQGMADACGTPLIYISSIEPIFSGICAAVFLVVPLEMSGVYRKAVNQLGLRLSATDTIALNRIICNGDFERLTLRLRADALQKQRMMTDYIERMLPFAKVRSSGMLGASLNVLVNNDTDEATLRDLCRQVNISIKEISMGGHSDNFKFRKKFQILYSNVDTSRFVAPHLRNSNEVAMQPNTQAVSQEVFALPPAANVFSL